jgi:hypothetical protein
LVGYTLAALSGCPTPLQQVDWNAVAAQQFAGAERLWRFHVARGWRRSWTARWRKSPALLIDPAGLGDTRVGLRTIAVLAEEPGQIRRAVLFVTAKIVDAGPAEIAKEQCAASLIAALSPITAVAVVAVVDVVAAFQRIKGIELRAHRRDDAADPIRLTGGHRA